MPRFVCYEEALAFARGQARLTPDGLARSLDATPAAAASFLRRLEEEGVIGPAGTDGGYPVVTERRRRWQTDAARPAAADPFAEVARLRTEAASLAQRAAAAEARLAEHARAPARIAVLRRLLARELHPDTAAPAADPALQAAYAEVFKRVWPRIERVLEGEDAEEA